MVIGYLRRIWDFGCRAFDGLFWFWFCGISWEGCIWIMINYVRERDSGDIIHIYLGPLRRLRFLVFYTSFDAHCFQDR